MDDRRIMSIESGIYHQPRCRYIRLIKKANRKEISQSRAIKKGLRPCKCCNSFEHRYQSEQYALDRYREKGMKYLVSRKELFVKTEESCWKIIYLPGRERVALFHRNYSCTPVNFEHPWYEKYHKQKDHFLNLDIEDCLSYIYEHDKFRAAVNAGNKTIAVCDKRYKKTAKRAINKHYRCRIDYLFRVVEGQYKGHGDMRQYSIC